jgi:phosphoglycerate dehydrogenase-like enzyme
MTAPILVVEDDPFPRLLQVILDPAAPAARIAAFNDFFAHDLPDFSAWCSALRSSPGSLYPATVRLVSSQRELAAGINGATIAVIESLNVGENELAAADALRVVQKYGTITSSIDTTACARRGIAVLTLRRRANMACAEHALGLMLALARRLCEINGLISIEQLRNAGFAPTTFDRAHTANANWARISGLRTLHGTTLGIIGMGEIGRELALRAAACGMRIIYTQRKPLPADDEARYAAQYAPLSGLLAAADYVSLHLPGNAETRHIIGRREFGQFKPGAFLINISRAELVDHDALLEALDTQQLGGYATDTPREEPGSSDDPLLALRNVVITPHIAAQPRFNALGDFGEMLAQLAKFT